MFLWIDIILNKLGSNRIDDQLESSRYFSYFWKIFKLMAYFVQLCYQHCLPWREFWSVVLLSTLRLNNLNIQSHDHSALFSHIWMFHLGGHTCSAQPSSAAAGLLWTHWFTSFMIKVDIFLYLPPICWFIILSIFSNVTFNNWIPARLTNTLWT